MSESTTAFQEPTGSQTPAPAPSPEPSSSQDHWLGDDYKDHVSLKDYPSQEALIKSHLNLQSMLGKSVRIPGNDASDKQREDFYTKLSEVDGVVKVPSNPEDADGWGALYKKMGRPDSVEGYGVDADERTLNLYHSLGLNPSQARALEERGAQAKKNTVDARVEAAKIGNENLRKDWGDGYDRNMTNAALAAKQLGGEELYNAMKSDEFLGGEMFVRAMAEAGKIIGDKKIPLNSTAESFNMTVDEAKAQISELMQNPDYQNSVKWAKDKMKLLHKKAYPDQ